MSKCEQCIVRQLNSLKELTKEELIRVSNCKTSQLVKKGDILFEEGEHINGVYCIRSGVCKVSKMSENGRDQIIHLVQRGDLLGQRSMVNNEISNLKAIAVNDMEVCFIPKEEIMKDLEANHNFTLDMLKSFATDLKNADNIIVNMGQKTVKQRLAQTLLYLKDNFGVTDNGNININLSREDFANIIGTATETVIRLLSEFKKKGFISLKGKEITILEERELKSVSEGV